MRIVFLTSFHERCGIATYSESLVAALERDAEVTILAPKRSAGDEGHGTQPPRLWNRNRAFGLEALRVRSAIRAAAPDVVHLQVNLSLYSSRFLFALVRLLARDRIPVVATLHGRDGGSWGRQFKLDRLLFGLRPADLIVHGAAHAAELARDRVHVIPHGIDPMLPRDRDRARDALGIDRARPVIAHFGFLVPDKGIADVMRAVAALRARHPQLLYWICGAIYQSAESRAHYAELVELARSLGLGDALHLDGAFVPMDRALLELAAADFVVLNYLTGGSQGASGAARRALTSGTPVAVSEAPIFDDVREAVHTLHPPLEGAIAALLDDRALAEATTESARRFCETHGWERVAALHLALYERVIAAKR